MADSPRRRQRIPVAARTDKGSAPAFVSEAIDRFPDCVRLLVSPASTNLSELRLDFELSFADMWVDLETKRFGILKEQLRFRFAVSSGELRLQLERLSSPPEKRNFYRDLPVRETVSRSISQQSTDTVERTGRTGIGLSKSVPDLSLERSRGSSMARTSHAEDTYTRSRVLVYHKGARNAPTWVFTCQTLDDTLAGSISDRLATLDVIGAPCGLTALFGTSLEGIRILEVDSLDFARATAKHQAVLKIKMRNYVREASKDALSEARVRSVTVN